MSKLFTLFTELDLCTWLLLFTCLPAPLTDSEERPESSWGLECSWHDFPCFCVCFAPAISCGNPPSLKGWNPSSQKRTWIQRFFLFFSLLSARSKPGPDHSVSNSGLQVLAAAFLERSLLHDAISTGVLSALLQHSATYLLSAITRSFVSDAVLSGMPNHTRLHFLRSLSSNSRELSLATSAMPTLWFFNSTQIFCIFPLSSLFDQLFAQRAQFITQRGNYITQRAHLFPVMVLHFSPKCCEQSEPLLFHLLLAFSDTTSRFLAILTEPVKRLCFL